MTQTYRELVVGGVLIAPIVSFAVTALLVFVVLRPVLHLVRFGAFFSNPALAELCLLISIFGLLALFS
jgi:hypothetical protein